MLQASRGIAIRRIAAIRRIVPIRARVRDGLGGAPRIGRRILASFSDALHNLQAGTQAFVSHVMGNACSAGRGILRGSRNSDHAPYVGEPRVVSPRSHDTSTFSRDGFDNSENSDASTTRQRRGHRRSREVSNVLATPRTHTTTPARDDGDDLYGFTPVEGVLTSERHRRRKRRALWGGVSAENTTNDVRLWDISRTGLQHGCEDGGGGGDEYNEYEDGGNTSDEDSTDDEGGGVPTSNASTPQTKYAWVSSASTYSTSSRKNDTTAANLQQAQKRQRRRRRHVPSLFSLASDAFVKDMLPSAFPGVFARVPLDIVQQIFNRAVAHGALTDVSLAAFHGCQLARIHVGRQAATSVGDRWLAHLLTHGSQQTELLSMSLVHLPHVTERGVQLIIHQCPNLRNLRLDGCYRGCTDESLAATAWCSMHKLEKLSVAMCDGITSAGVSSIARMPNLRALNLEMCSQVSLVGVLGRLRQLRVLNFAYCTYVNDSDITHLSKNLPYLAELNLARTAVTDAGVAYVAAWKRTLMVLSVSGCAVTNASLGAICHCEKLEVLELSWCAVDDEGFHAEFCGESTSPSHAAASLDSHELAESPSTTSPMGIELYEFTSTSTPTSPRPQERRAQLPNLLRLNLSHTRIGDETLDALRHAGASRLVELNLDRTRVSASGIKTIAEAFPLMRSLVLTDTNVSNMAASSLRRMRHLRDLCISYSGINDEGLADFAESGAPALRTLRADNRAITDDGVAALVGLRDSLRHLDLFSSRITDVGAASIAQLTRLRTLEVCSGQITDNGALMLAEELENMQRLNLGHNTLITERTVAGIVKGMPNLRSLNLMQARITSSSLDKIAGLRRLENLCVHGTRVSLAAVEALQQKLKNLQVTL